MSLPVVYERREILPGIHSLTEQSRIIKIRRALGRSCVKKIAQLMGDYETRRTNEALAVVMEELPTLVQAFAEMADYFNDRRQTSLRASEWLASPILYRSRTTPPHIDSHEFDAFESPVAYGPLSISIGVRGDATFLDYGRATEGLVDIDRLPEERYVLALSALVESLIEGIEEGHITEIGGVVQEAGDIVIIPSVPFPHLHEVSNVSVGRAAIVGGQLWVDSSEYDIDDPRDLAIVQAYVYQRIRRAPPQA